MFEFLSIICRSVHQTIRALFPLSILSIYRSIFFQLCVGVHIWWGIIHASSTFIYLFIYLFFFFHYLISDDIEYRYTISIPTSLASNQDNTVTNQTGTKNITVYQSGSISANQELEVIVEGLHNSAVYTVTVWAVNIVGNKSSEPVIVFADLTVTGKNL